MSNIFSGAKIKMQNGAPFPHVTVNHYPNVNGGQIFVGGGNPTVSGHAFPFGFGTQAQASNTPHASATGSTFTYWQQPTPSARPAPPRAPATPSPSSRGTTARGAAVIEVAKYVRHTFTPGCLQTTVVIEELREDGTRHTRSAVPDNWDGPTYTYVNGELTQTSGRQGHQPAEQGVGEDEAQVLPAGTFVLHVDSAGVYHPDVQ